VAGALAMVLTGALQGAWANPLPMGGTLFHVHPVDPQFCDPCPVTQCSQIVQHTTATGLLEFDLFVEHVEFHWQGRVVYALSCQIEWCPSWTLVADEICGGGVGSLQPIASNSAALMAEWPECPMVLDRVWPVARFVFQTTGYGKIEADWHNLSLTLGCPPNSMVETGLVTVPGVAGVECGYCDSPCDFGQPCQAEFLPDSYDVHLLSGE
jgi:hypothetical protein